MAHGPVMFFPNSGHMGSVEHGSKTPNFSRMENGIGRQQAVGEPRCTAVYGPEDPSNHSQSYQISNGWRSSPSDSIIDQPAMTSDRLARRYYASADPLVINTLSTRPLETNNLSSTKERRPTMSSTTSSPSNQSSPSNASLSPKASSPSKTSLSPLEGLFRRNPHHSDVQSKSSAVLECTGEADVESVAQDSPITQFTPTPDSTSASSSLLGAEGIGIYGISAPGGEPARPARAVTGFTLRNKIKFAGIPRPHNSSHKILRSPSLGTTSGNRAPPDFAFPADSGVGLKSRRLSASLPNNFHVDSCELSNEFVSGSRIPGRRGKEIGKGATATVKIMYRKGCPKDVQYAVKEFRKCGRNENQRDYEQKLKSEFSIANSLHHSNIVKTIRLCRHSGRWNHVMEFCEPGELYSLVQKGYLTVEDNFCLFKQLLHGVAFLHANGIAHRDIKLENLLMSGDGHLKITDFGVSEVFCGIHPGLRAAGGECGKSMGEVRRCSPGICGSLPYIAPEVLAKTDDYDPRFLDVWSCAIVCLALFFRGTPWQSAKPEDANYSRFLAGWHKFLLKKSDGIITETDYPSCGRIFSMLPRSSLKRSILRMLHPDPERRSSISDILEDRLMKTIDCCCPESADADETESPIDAADKQSGKLARMKLQRMHNHLPPEKKRG